VPWYDRLALLRYGAASVTRRLRKVKRAGRKVAFNHAGVGIGQKFEGNNL
jgi:hypothetical protein